MIICGPVTWCRLIALRFEIAPRTMGNQVTCEVDNMWWIFIHDAHTLLGSICRQIVGKNHPMLTLKEFFRKLLIKRVLLIWYIRLWTIINNVWYRQYWFIESASLICRFISFICRQNSNSYCRLIIQIGDSDNWYMQINRSAAAAADYNVSTFHVSYGVLISMETSWISWLEKIHWVNQWDFELSQETAKKKMTGGGNAKKFLATF